MSYGWHPQYQLLSHSQDQGMQNFCPQSVESSRKTTGVQGHSGNHVLIVGNSLGTSRTLGKGVLTEVHPETKAIEHIVKGAIGAACTVPHPPFKKTVLDSLSSCSIAHFSCHGVTDPGNPCNSHLLLPGPGGTEADPLRIKELSNRNLDRSMLAYPPHATPPTIRPKPS